MTKKLKQWIALILAMTIIVSDCTAGYATESKTETIQSTFEEDVFASEETVQANEESPQVLFELEDLREKSTKQYRLSDGTILAAQYGMDVHYETQDGQWEEIDNRFVYETAEDAEDFDGYKTAEGAVAFKFASQVQQDGEILKIAQEEYSIGFQLLDSEAKVQDYLTEEWNVDISEIQSEEVVLNSEETEILEVSPSSITFLKGEVLNPEAVPQAMTLRNVAKEELPVVWTDVEEIAPEESDAVLLEDLKADNAVTSVGYGNVIPGVSLQYVLSGSSVKEYILVNEPQESYSYDFLMNLENLVPEAQADGSILLKDSVSGEAVYEIPAGYMTDAEGDVSDAVTMELITVSEENLEVTEETEEAETKVDVAKESWILRITADEE